MKKVIVIVGPTGVGKTKLSLALAHLFNGEIINADSTQVYRELDIATAKVEDKEGIPHHLIDIKNIDEDYTIYNFQQDGRKIIDKLLEEDKTPIVVGGSGLYIKALLYNYELDLEVKNNYSIDINDPDLYNMLLKVDPSTLIHPNNRQRVYRALNYYYANGVPLSEKASSEEIVYDTLFIGLSTDRSQLYDIINQRVDHMIGNGLLIEAKNIYDRQIRSKAVMTPIGYKELFPYFDGKISLEEATNKIKQNSRKYAKRQFTWFHNQMDVKWFDVNYHDFDKTIKDIISYIKKA